MGRFDPILILFNSSTPLYLRVEQAWHYQNEKKAMRYLRDVIRVDPKLFGKRISRDDILTILRENKKLQSGARLSKKLEDAIQAIIGRHNASLTKQNIDKYSKNKNMYSLTFKAVVWNEQLHHEYIDDVAIAFLLGYDIRSNHKGNHL